MMPVGRLRTFAICVALALSACSAAQVAQVQSDIATGIQAACSDVAAAAKLNPASPVAAWANGACPLGVAAASLGQNSATIPWLGQVQQPLARAPAPQAGVT